MIERGIARGDLRPDTEVRLLFSGDPLDRKVSTGLVDAILDSFAPDGKEGTRLKRRSLR